MADPTSANPTDGDKVVLVDRMGRAVDTMEKMAAHQEAGQWHAAFSVVIFDPAGRMLLQRRAAGKYHFAGRWTNACCSHPRPGESLADAVRRRVAEELGLGLSDSDLHLAGSFWYCAHDPRSGLHEAEFDQVVVVHGLEPARVLPNPSEVDEVAWVTPSAVRKRCAAEPESVTPWLERVLQVSTRDAGAG